MMFKYLHTHKQNQCKGVKIMKTAINVLIGTMIIFSVFLTQNSAWADEVETRHRGTRTIRFDVAENGSRFVFDDAPVHEDTTPPATRLRQFVYHRGLHLPLWHDPL